MNYYRAFKAFTAILILLSVNNAALAQNSGKDPAKINFINFTINSSHNRILIDWATDNKVPTNYFEIERSRDGKNFQTIEMVLGPDPTRTGCDCYEGFDKADANADKYFYRLKHVGINGEVELSETKMLAINK